MTRLRLDTAATVGIAALAFALSYSNLAALAARAGYSRSTRPSRMTSCAPPYGPRLELKSYALPASSPKGSPSRA